MSDKTPDILIPAEFGRLLDTDWREAAVYGGRFSLKSHTVARVLLIRAMQKKTRILCTREFQSSISDSSMQLLSDLIDYYHLYQFRVMQNSIINQQNGSDFLFKGLRNNVQSVKSTEGVDIAWQEEAQSLSENSIEVLTPTVRKPGSQLIYTYNRLRDADPIHKRLVIEGRPNSIAINVNYDVAMKYGWMPQSIIAEMEDDKAKRPEIYSHKWLGEPSNKKGAIYSNFQHIESIPKEARYIGAGLDFGYTNDPTALIDVYKWNNAYILDEVLYQTKLQNKYIAGVITGQQHYSGELIVADSAEPKSIADISELGVNITGATKGKDSINNGIQLLQGLEIYYTDRSHNIEEEVLNYSWRIDKEDKALNVPIDSYNHALDAARYKITDVENFKPMEWAAPE